ncbi:MAG: ABC transporter ATP-binding protein [Saccharofermentanales bacterium]
MLKFKSIRLPIYRQLIDMIPKKKYLHALFVIKIGFLLLGIITPLFYKLFIDNVLINKNIGLLAWVIAGYAVVFGLETILVMANRVVNNKCFQVFCAKLRIRILDKYTKMPANEYEKYNAGDLDNRIQNDVNSCQNFFTDQFIQYYYSWATVIIYGAILLYLSWKLALFGFLMIPVSFLLTKVLAKKSGKISEEYREKWGKYEGFVHSSLQNWREIKALNAMADESAKFTGLWDALSKLFVKRQVLWYLNRGFIAFKDLFITKMNLYFIGGLLIFSGQMTVGSLLVFMVYYEVMFGNIGAINDLDIKIASIMPSINRVFEILNRNDGNMQARKIYGFQKLELSRVSFSYSDAADVLKNINFEIEKGERIAIVGKSGCGKTTLAKLLLNIYEPKTGAVLIDDIDAADIDKQSFHRVFGIVMQEPYLFNLTIRDNLCLAMKDANETILDKVCMQAGIYDFIDSLPSRYDTVIGERGIKLSGGQKQRLAIARSLLKKSEIIIFDEATSSLDYAAEKHVQQVLDNIAENRTIITIAHRLSSILSAKRVIVLDDGEIVGIGTHEQLKGRCEYYDNLFAGQYVI